MCHRACHDIHSSAMAPSTVHHGPHGLLPWCTPMEYVRGHPWSVPRNGEYAWVVRGRGMPWYLWTNPWCRSWTMPRRLPWRVSMKPSMDDAMLASMDDSIDTRHETLHGFVHGVGRGRLHGPRPWVRPWTVPWRHPWTMSRLIPLTMPRRRP